MTHKARTAIAAGVALLLLGAQPSRAEPMKCSGELKTCIAGCAKNSNGAVAARCVQNCHASQSICMRSGCWDTGTSRYCGLMKQ